MPRIGRVLATVLSLWLPLFMSEAEWLVRCPTHGGGAQVAQNDATGLDGAIGHGHSADHSSSPADHDGGHSCSCPGPSCCPPAVVVLSGSVGQFAHIVAVHEATAQSALEIFSTDRDYLLPFATAPPALALAPAALSIA